ncbi:MAG: C25 family cysteine peptidase [Chitinispirillia bacterium]|nr:C25 family cysteine peptidase [Chitinispirillia bacterium]MCL2268021.1 C25 family cysteine peptidase [Chitinispirillia bacterium]
MIQRTVIILALVCSAAFASLTVVESTPSRLVLSWEMTGFEASTFQDEGGGWSRVSYDGGYVPTGGSGEAMIPGYAIHAGIPPQGAVRVTVTPEELSTVRIDRPLAKRPYDAGPAEHIFSSRWSSDPKYGMFRDYRSVSVVLRPVYDAGQGRVQLLKRARIVIDFPASPHTGVTWAPRGGYESTVRSLLINFNTAQGWQLSRGRALRKAASDREPYPFAHDQRFATFRVGDGFRYGNEVTINENALIRISGKRIRELFGDVPMNTVSLYASHKGEMNLEVPLFGEIPAGIFEIPVMRYDLNGNGMVDDADYIVAYVSAASDWSYSTLDRHHFSLNRYDDYRTYRLTAGVGAGMEMAIYDQPAPEPILGVNEVFEANLYFREPTSVFHLHKDYGGGAHSGSTDWPWRRFTLDRPDTTIRLDLPGIDMSRPGQIWFYQADNGLYTHGHVSVGPVGFTSLSVRLDQVLDTAVPSRASSSSITSFQIDNWGVEPRELRIGFRNTAFNSRSYYVLNAIQLRYRRFLRIDNNSGLLDVFSSNSPEPAQYRLNKTAAGLAYVLRVPVYEGGMSLIDTIRGSSLTWSDYGNQGTRFKVVLEKDIVDYSDSLRIVSRPHTGSAEYQVRELRSASNSTDYLMITHEEFLSAAVKLAEHKVNMGFARPRVVLLSDILEQFGGGNTDPAAIRNFLLYVYRNWDRGDIFSYVAFFGLGHYDYKYVTTRQTNFMPVPYLNGKINQDFYVHLDAGSVHPNAQYNAFYLMGRFPAKSGAEAHEMVQKTIETEDPRFAEFDAWRSRVLMSYDDDQQGQNMDNIRNHMKISEAASRTVERLRPDIDLRKLPLLEYEWDDRYYKPGATRTFINEINNGVALVNWVGHGAYDIIADERMFRMEDVSALYNRRRYPVFSLLSCSIGKFDIPNGDCISSMLIRLPSAGAVAVVSSARESLAADNETLADPFFTALFDTTAGANTTISSALAIAKQRSISGNNTYYITLGDPSVNLLVRNRTVGLEITDGKDGAPLDTLKAMQQVVIKGTVKNSEGQKDDAFGGYGAFVNVTLFNPPQDSVRRKDGGRFFYKDAIYSLPGSPVFSAKIPVVNGEFEQPLLLPMNLVFGKPGVRVTAHAWKAGDTLIGGGHLGGLIFAGSVSGNVNDSVGPRISVRPIYNNINMDQAGLFVKNRVTAQLPLTLEVSIEDESGINLIGSGPDEGLSMEVRGALSKRAINHLFQFSEGSFRQGTATLLFEENSLRGGTAHELIISAQDLLGNVSNLSVSLDVVDPAEIKLDHVINVPNPVRMGRETRFYYNHSDVDGYLDIQVTIRVYTLGGRLLAVIRNPRNGEAWIPRDQAGNMLTPNVYLYQVTATSPNINRTVKSKIKKLVVHPPR